jgi:hypothetical protein
MIDQIVKSLYSETDSARSIATSGSGIAGSVIDLKQCDWFIAAFSGVFIFPSPAFCQRRFTSAFIEPKSTGQSERIRMRGTT